jgi:hypothetical protein
VTDDRPPSLLPALLELVGASFVVLGVALIWLPLGLIAVGLVLVVAAVAVERAADASKVRT